MKPREKVEDRITKRRWLWLRGELQEHYALYLFGSAAGIVGLLLVVRAGLDWGNVGGELFGIAVTVLIIDYLVRRREEERQKRHLIFEMGSSLHDVAIKASEELRRCGALMDGSLEGAQFSNAHLDGVRLNDAHLRRASFKEAQMKNGHLQAAHLEGASLLGVHLEGAFLNGAHLQKAQLVEAHLESAHLNVAKLGGANLRKAHLQGARLREAILEDADLRGADLQGVRGLTKEQLTQASGNVETKLPSEDLRPDHWR